MKKEKIYEIWRDTVDPDYRVNPIDFARGLLLECAKIVCFMCREGNVPEKGVHIYSKMSHEPCRATRFYIEDEK